MFCCFKQKAELDALRAKRAMEQNERNARDKERREAELRVRNIIVLISETNVICLLLISFYRKG